MAGAAAARRGKFIVFEGGDGAGKSTQIARLAERLRAAGHDVVVTREPGGSLGAEAIRQLLVEGAPDRWSPLAEALLMYAARADHLERTIMPALARGAIVLSDRFSDSTMAYQGLAGGLGRERIETLEGLVVGAEGPDLVVVLDVPVDVGLSRARTGAESRFEAKGQAFQQRVRDGYLAIAAGAPERCAVVDATQPVEKVAQEIAELVRARLKLDL
jgi:dTMP kinase